MYVFIWLRWVFATVWEGFSLVVVNGSQLRCRGFSLQRLLVFLSTGSRGFRFQERQRVPRLQSTGSARQLWHTGSAVLWHMGSSQTWNRTVSRALTSRFFNTERPGKSSF